MMIVVRGFFFAWGAILLVLLAAIVSGSSSCPRKCQCIWRDSKITVDCSDQELAAIPTTVEANTQVRLFKKYSNFFLKNTSNFVIDGWITSIINCAIAKYFHPIPKP